MEDLEIPMTASLPVNISDVPSAVEKVSNESFLQDAVLPGNEETESSEVTEEIFEEDVQGEIIDSLEIEPEENETVEEIPPTEKVFVLENEVLGLKEINSQLAERVSNLEMKNQVSAETLLQLALILQKLAEEEEQGEKTGMLEVLINFLVFFMKEAFVPEDENEKTQHAKKIEPKMKTHPRRVSEILQLLKNESALQPFKTPHIEKQAA